MIFNNNNGRQTLFILLALLSLFLCVGAPTLAAPVTPAKESAPDAASEKPDNGEATEEGDDEKSDTAADETDNPSHSLSGPSFGEYLSGRFAEEQGDTNKGIRFLKDSLKRDPNNKETLASLYRMLMLSGKTEEALQIAPKLAGVKVVEEGSEFSPEMLMTIDAIKQGKYAEADTNISAMPKTGFNSLLLPLLQSWMKLGEKELKKPVEAKDIMPEAKAILPHVYLNIAMINDLAGFDSKALEQYEASIKDPRIEPFQAVEALANYYNRKNMNDKREKLVSDYLAAHGDSFLADELLVEPAGANPKPLVTNATEGGAEVFYTMANIFHGVRAPADEIATLHLALYLRPDFPAAQFLLANTYELAQEYADAIATYKSINKDSAYFLRGRIRGVYDQTEMGGNKTAALAELDAIANERPTDIDSLLAKGDILRSDNHFKEAIAAYDQALARVKTPQKRHWVMYFSRGVCYERLGQMDKAEADMKESLVLSPGEPDVLNYLGYSWLTQNRHMAEAKKMIEDAYEARPEDAHIIDSMGFAFYTSGDYASAIEYFQQALERTPDDPTVNDHLGDAYWQQGHKTDAQYQWQRALADDPDDETKRDLNKKLQHGLEMLHPLNAVENKKSPETPVNE